MGTALQIDFALMKADAIHLAPGRRLPMRPVGNVVAEADKSLVGDRYHALRGRAGSAFRILTSGTFGVGDTVEITEP